MCSIFERCIPETPAQDLGFGSLYGRGGQELLQLLHALGFDSISLGPSGQTTLGNASPYDGTVFTRSHLSISLGAFIADRAYPALLLEEELALCAAARPDLAAGRRTSYSYAFDTQRQLLARAFERWQNDAAANPIATDLAQRLSVFKAQAEPWLLRDALYRILCDVYGSERPESWREESPALDARLFAPLPVNAQHALARVETLVARHQTAIERYSFIQLIAQEQHAALRTRLKSLGIRLVGDMQAGLSLGDRWAQRAILLRDYAMGAPPSRTNPEGQPWGYPLLDPDQYLNADGGRGPGLQFVAARIAKLFSEHDAVRIDHPHALVCPWVYRSDVEDPFSAVRAGARLFSSPDLPDHPQLSAWAIAGRADLSARSDTTRFADDWVCRLNDTQAKRYGLAFEVLLEEALRVGRGAADFLCEVLSTLPHPLERVLARHGLGRFRVTQKADLTKPDDVYRAENAHPNDWIMVGNHDTLPLLGAVERWRQQGAFMARADYLAGRLASDSRRESFAQILREVPGALAAAELANLFIGPARNVIVFVFDLFGETEPFNTPGTVGPHNWSLRLPNELTRAYEQRLHEGLAMNVPLALAMALRARGVELARAHAGLLARLDVAALLSPPAATLLAAQR